jgi:hypothetical protein
LINSVGDLWCRAQYGVSGTDTNGGADNNCIGQIIYADFYYPWLRSARNDNRYVWNIFGDSSSDMAFTYSDTNVAFAILPAFWLSSSICTGSGGGTKSSPYSLEACPTPAKLTITTTAGSTGAGITLSGTAKAGDNGQSMMVWADVCNTAEQCVRKTYSGFANATSNTAQNWTLTWTAAQLPAGTYNGMVWVGLTAGSNNLFAQSGAVNFAISSVVKTFEATVIKNKAFSLSAGPVASFDITLGTNSGVTAGSSGGKLVLSSATGLTSNTTATFGNTRFEITVVELPQITVSNVSFE